MNLKEMRAAALKAANDIIGKAKAEDRDLTDEEVTEVEAKHAEIESLDEQIAKSAKSSALIEKLAGVKTVSTGDEPDEEDAPKGGLISERFVKSRAFRGFRKTHPSGVGSGTPIRIEAKGLGSVRELGIGTKELTTQTGQWSGHGRESGYRSELPADEPLTFLSLITVGTTDNSYSEYAQVIGETDNAAVVLEGDLKPLSEIETDDASSSAYTYADGFDVTNQMLADDGALVAFMESRIRRHVRGVVERKLLNGTGAGVEPLGILNTTGTLAQAFTVDVVQTLGRALEAFETANEDVEPQAIVMRSSDIWNLRFLKNEIGDYILGNPLQQGPIPTPWGVPIVRSNKLGAGQALVGRFDSMNYLELEPLAVLAFNQHKDYAQRNKTYVRAETRGRQAFYAPREVVVADIAGPSGGGEG